MVAVFAVEDEDGCLLGLYSCRGAAENGMAGKISEIIVQ